MFPEPEDTGNGDTPAEETKTEAGEEPKSENANPFESFFSDNGEEPKTEEENGGDDYKLDLTANDGFEDDEVVWLTDICKRHNLPADTAVAFLKEMYAEADTRGKEQEQKAQTAAVDALKSKWGNSFDSNTRKAASLIKSMGGRLGWESERMKSMLNAHDIEMMFEFSRYIGNNAMRGLEQTATPQRAKDMTPDEMQTRLGEIMTLHYNARKAGDGAKMKELSDEHYELLKKMNNGKARRILLDK